MRLRLSWLLLSFCPTLAGADTKAPAPARVLRVCADPGNLPYSDARERGFENTIARLLARELHARLTYTWWAQRRGSFRNTLNAHVCDVVVGVPVGVSAARTTQPYYRSSFAFVTRKDRHLTDIRSIDDPRLRSLKIGVPLAGDDGNNPAPAHVLSRRGITSLIGYSLWEGFGRQVPLAVEAVADGSIDLALLWGPVAGASTKSSGVPLAIEPVQEQRDGDIPLAFSIAMAVRPGDVELAEELNAVISKNRGALRNIVKAAGVPLLPLPAH